jgi:two-component system, chemotaxis family, chemotaxis protein CheY
MSKKILIIDDSSTVRQQVGILLTEAGYEVLQAVDGIDGLSQIRAGGKDLELVFCDVHMPNMSGIDMLKMLARDAVQLPPIVMLTTEGNPSSITQAKEAGARGWIVKPVKPETLLATVRKIAGTP